MGYSSYPPASGGKTAYRTTLTSGTSYTVPAGVTYLNVLCVGGGGGAGASYGNYTNSTSNAQASGGECIRSIVTTSGGSTISYSIGAGGSGAAATSAPGSAGGTTSFTGATSAAGGNGGAGSYNNQTVTGAAAKAGFADNWGRTSGYNQGGGGDTNGGAGGPGWIEIEYWV